jgi:hypothetical protein
VSTMRMRLTWHDSAATLLTGLVVAGYALFLAGVDLPLIASVRGMAGAVLVAGMLGCALGSAEPYQPGSTGWSRRTTGAASFVGAVALFAAITALVTASEVALAALVGGTVVLWVLATLRHSWRPRTTSPESTDLFQLSRRHHPVGRG